MWNFPVKYFCRIPKGIPGEASERISVRIPKGMPGKNSDGIPERFFNGNFKGISKGIYGRD